MSKQRPCSRLADVETDRRQARQPPRSDEYWLARVYKNSFTRNGRRFFLSKWSVKIQHLGVRRTFSLKTTNRLQAAREARNLYDAIQAGGGKATGAEPSRPLGPQKFGSRGPGKPSSARSFDHWKDRLIYRKYLDLAKRSPGKEFSVRIEHQGLYQFFPLGTDDPDAAARQASEIHRSIVAEGWNETFRRFIREITVSIFWSENPVACTYTTLITPVPDQHLQEHLGLSRKARSIYLIEPDPGLGGTLAFWLNRQAGFCCPRVVDSAEEAARVIAHHKPALLLVNRNVPEVSPPRVIEEIKSRWPNLPVFKFGIYEESDQIFISLTGVEAGYIFRRRAPTQLLEPIQGAGFKQTFSADQHTLQIRRYFQNLFNLQTSNNGFPEALLTVREQEILNYLSKGLLDKEIADRLRISFWTVHNHLKKIYGKLGVHNRTGAVLSYLQK